MKTAIKVPIIPEGGFSLLYPDPPWKYKDKGKAGKRGAAMKYPVMSLKELMAMRPFIDSVAAKDCALVMWVTGPHLPDGLALMKAWGFKFKTNLFTWIKVTKGTRTQVSMIPKFHFGLGHWTRKNSEVWLLGVRGKHKRVSKGVPEIIVSPLREHSRKPAEARERLEKLFGDVTRLEMFARESAPGWSAWGLEVGKFDLVPEEA